MTRATPTRGALQLRRDQCPTSAPRFQASVTGSTGGALVRSGHIPSATRACVCRLLPPSRQPGGRGRATGVEHAPASPALTLLDRKCTLRSAAYPSRSVPNRPPPTTVSSAVITAIVVERLCGSIPMTTRPDPADVLTPSSDARSTADCRAERADTRATQAK